MNWRKAGRRKRVKKFRSFSSKHVTSLVRMDWDCNAQFIRDMIRNALYFYPLAKTVDCIWNGELVGGLVKHN
jgi:hypothetical protein